MRNGYFCTANRNMTDARNAQNNAFRSYKSGSYLNISCDTCAYVTSSGHLLGSGSGTEIDSKTCVIRSNVSPICGFERDVGNNLDLIQFI